MAMLLDVAASSDREPADLAEPAVPGGLSASHSTAFEDHLSDLGVLRRTAPTGADGKTYEVNQPLLDEVIRASMPPLNKGKPVAGIPNTNPDPEAPSITVMNAKTGQIVSAGDTDHLFSQQSMSKPTAMALAIKLMGGGHDAYRRYVAVEASGRPYNDAALLADGRSFNSNVNIGALATWVLIHAHTPEGQDPFELYLNLMKQMTGNPNLRVNDDMAEGEFKHKPAGGGKSGNEQLMEVLEQKGLMKVLRKPGDRSSPEEQKKAADEVAKRAFLNYCRACAVMVNTPDMAKVAAVYRNGGVLMDPSAGATQVLPKAIADFVHGSNDVSGSYNESGTQFAKNKFGGKSGVDGGIFGSLHGHDGLVVATYHSDLNAAGNSGAGQKWIARLNKMKLAFPPDAAPQRADPPRGGIMTRILSAFSANGAPAHNSQSGLGTLSPGDLGPSPRELDQRLGSQTTESSLDTLRTKLGALNGREGFYMKLPNFSKSKDPLLGAVKLLTAPDKQDRLKNYYLAEGDHQLHKVVVTDITDTHQLAVDIPDTPLGIPSAFLSLDKAVRTGDTAVPDNNIAAKPLGWKNSINPASENG
jgi:glutaminase